MAQNSDNQAGPCGTCRAKPGAPCTTRSGREALKVHWGRGSTAAQRFAQRSRGGVNGAATRARQSSAARADFAQRNAHEIREAESRRYGD